EVRRCPSRGAHVLDGRKHVPPEEERQSPIEAGSCSAAGRSAQGAERGIVTAVVTKQRVRILNSETDRTVIPVHALIGRREIVRAGWAIPNVVGARADRYPRRVGKEKSVRAAVNETLRI